MLYRIAGPVALATGLDAKMHDVVLVGTQELLGEVIGIDGEKVIIQVYEDTSGVRPGEPAKNTHRPMSVELGPGLLTSIFDGIQRPLPALAKSGDFIDRGARVPALDRKKKWPFVPVVKDGTRVSGGSVLGHVEEVPGFTHRILVPPGQSGVVSGIKAGNFTVEDTIATLTTDGKKVPLRLMQEWPVRVPRPVAKRFTPEVPLITGQRVMDVLFPVAKGGTAIISGPFGAGKTVGQHQLAKWSDADIIIYVGCGERGNEMTDVLVSFPKLSDPRNGAPLMHRTVLIANTSNMPVAAREASIYTGVTIAEYFRDMGYNVALMADSTSRWAEALREISSRLEEMPGEEGYPAYLASRVAAFYERASYAQPLGSPDGTRASLTIIGAVSPPGGDFFEPVTQASLRVSKVFWALDARIAQRRHFPSINWLDAYSLYTETLAPWYAKLAPDWSQFVSRINILLQEEARLTEIVQVVGSDALAPNDQFTLHIARLIREGLLQQQAPDPVDTYCAPKKSYRMMRLIVIYWELGAAAVRAGVQLPAVTTLGLSERIYKLKIEREYDALADVLERELREKLKPLADKKLAVDKIAVDKTFADKTTVPPSGGTAPGAMPSGVLPSGAKEAMK